MKTIAIAGLIAAAISTAPLAHASPSVGDVCYDWKATAQDANGQTLVCTHLPDSGHLMYWETHTESWYEGFHYDVSGWKTDPVTPNPQPGDDHPYGHNGPCNSNDVHISKITPKRADGSGGNAIEVWGPLGCDPSLPMTGTN
jgi:hypothetical protein